METIPPGWGQNDLTKAWDKARANQFATFANKPGAFHRLAAIDLFFHTFVTDWVDPESELSAFLFLRSHSAFRAASGVAAAGQAVELI